MSNSDNEPHNDDEDATDPAIYAFAYAQLIKGGLDAEAAETWADELARDIDALIESTIEAADDRGAAEETRWRFTRGGSLIMPDEDA